MARSGAKVTGSKKGKRRPSPVKRRIYEILEEGVSGDRTSTWIDRVLMTLVVLNVAAVVLETVPNIYARYAFEFLVFEIISVAIFTVEYGLRFWVSDIHIPLRHMGPLRARLNYLGDPYGLIDLIAILPFYLSLLGLGGDLRLLRIFRLVRFLKLVRYSTGLRSLVNALIAEYRALVATLIIMVSLVLATASIMYLVEHEAQPQAFGSIPAAIWWSVTTLTTVGYGDVVPVTAMGRSIGVVVMVLGLAMYALPIGIVATAFSQEIHRRDFVVTWAMIARVPLFADFSAVEISEVMRLLHARKIEQGAFVVHRGDEAHSMYFIASGTVEVVLPNGVETLSEGMFFGEIALLRKSSRSADIIAKTPVNLLLLNAHDLHALMAKNPTMAKQLQNIARKRINKDRVTPGGDIVSEELEIEPEDPISEV